MKLWFLKALGGSALLGGLAGCAFGVDDIDTVPEHPTYEADVRPLLEDHCVLCHGARPSRGAPDEFRVDVYDDVDGRLGAHTNAELMLELIRKDEMPPAAEWGDGIGPNGRALLENWARDGYPR